MELNHFNWSVEVPIQTVPQPKPHFNPSGDCGGCCLAGVLGWPADRIPTIYEHSLRPSAGGELRKVGALSWGDLFIMADGWMHLGLKATEPIALDPVQPDMRDWQEIMHNPFASAPWAQVEQWLHRLRLYLQSGYVGLTTMSFDGNGPLRYTRTGRVMSGETDHWVLLNGARQGWEPDGNGTALTYWVRVSCSVRGDYWIKADEFLAKHGGYWVAFIRRVPSVAPVMSLTTNA